MTSAMMLHYTVKQSVYPSCKQGFNFYSSLSYLDLWFIKLLPEGTNGRFVPILIKRGQIISFHN